MLKRGDLVKLLRVVVETHETEIGCDECFEQLDRFVEAELSGSEARSVMPLVGDHLDKCADCRSKFEVLRTAVRST
ncbi:MAG: hypothetical protein M3305_01240 [Actinomycetota bacterium]|nr:hypothetical protein [Actinomycetota bacterium]